VSSTQFRYFIINKPFNVLCQFTPDLEGQLALGNLFDLPKDVYPVGRLDLDSEGLLILTNDKLLTHKLLNPKFQHKRTYWAQLEGIPTNEALEKLEKGVTIKVEKRTHLTLPATAFTIEPQPQIEERNPPIRFRAQIPTTWISLTIHEGKNRQVRKMCAATGFPCLRLIRKSIENLQLEDLKSGEILELNKEEIIKKLKL
jgi:23S rRNA pseudouridine2457 synthase